MNSYDSIDFTPTDSNRKTGRPVFDAQGTRWEWQIATGVYSREISEEQMNAVLGLAQTTRRIGAAAPPHVTQNEYWAHQNSSSAGRKPLTTKQPAKPTLLDRLKRAFSR